MLRSTGHVEIDEAARRPRAQRIAETLRTTQLRAATGDVYRIAADRRRGIDAVSHIAERVFPRAILRDRRCEIALQSCEPRCAERGLPRAFVRGRGRMF